MGKPQKQLQKVAGLSREQVRDRILKNLRRAPKPEPKDPKSNQ